MEEIFKILHDYIEGMIQINNEMLIKMIFLSKLDNSLTCEYLLKKELIKKDFDDFCKENAKAIGEGLLKQAEEVIKEKYHKNTST